MLSISQTYIVKTGKMAIVMDRNWRLPNTTPVVLDIKFQDP